MPLLYQTIDACLLCAQRAMRFAVGLAPMPIATPNFTVPEGVSDAEARAGVPLDLYQCERCGHVQVGAIGNPEFQYRDYVYTTSLSLGLPEHFRNYAHDVAERCALEPGAFVVELGSNDGTLLRAFADLGMRVQGVDPARRIAAEATARGIPTRADFFSPEVARAIRAEHGPARVIIANNMLANVPDLAAFGEGVATLLDDGGFFVFETQYGGDVVERALLDTVYHEHISYFLIAPTQRWLAALGLTLVDVVPIATKGGSFRAIAVKASSATAGASVAEWIARERASGMFAQPFFSALETRLATMREALATIVAGARARGESVGGFGVSVGTSTLLAQLRLEQSIDVLFDDDPKKEPYLRGPGYQIPVRHGSALRESGVKIVIVFAWRYTAVIRAKHADFIAAGGRFVVPIPEVRVLGAQT